MRSERRKRRWSRLWPWLVAALLAAMGLGGGCADGADVLHALGGPGSGSEAGSDIATGDTGRPDITSGGLGDASLPPPFEGCGDGACDGPVEDCVTCSADCACDGPAVCRANGSCGAALTCGPSACPAPPAGWGATDCGPGDVCRAQRTLGDQIETLLWVPAGSFPMGSDDTAGGSTAEGPAHTVNLAEFWVDADEVTAGAYAAFLTLRGSNQCAADSDCVDPDVSTRLLDWDGAEAQVRSVCQRTPNGASDESCAAHPVVEVTWYGADAYCRAYGGRLCSESEWERAAQPPAPTDQPYPWGDDTIPGRANCPEEWCEDGYDETAPVGSFRSGASALGARDLAGNVWEWTADDWHDDYGTPGGAEGHPTDGSAWIDAPRADRRAVRGGSHQSTVGPTGPSDLELRRRRPAAPEQSSPAGGFRCCY